MRELKIGERIPIEAGGEAVVSRELGRGGQGIVYLVIMAGSMRLNGILSAVLKIRRHFAIIFERILRMVRRRVASSLSGRYF